MATISTNDIKIRYVVDADNIQKAAQTFDNLTDQEKQALAELKKFNNETKAASAGVSNLGGVATKAGGAIAAIFAVDKIVSFGKVIAETTAKFQQLQKAIDFASGSSIKGAENFQFLKDLTAKLGLDLMSAAEGYKTFAASSNLAGVSIQETNRQFEAVSKAVAALGLSSEDAKGVFLALGQIISKGTVASEELRGQIGERLPGAFNIAAKSMGVTTAELGKMLQKGEVASRDFLPKFATELENTFGTAAANNLNTMTASQNKFNSAIDGLILAVGNKLQPFLKGAYDLAAGIATSLTKAAGGGAKQQSMETLAAKRAEADIAKTILDISIKEGVFIERRRAAEVLLFQMEDKQMKALTDRANARIAKDTIAEKKAQQQYDLLVAEEEILTKIAGVVVNTPPPQPTITEKERVKALKEQYDARMRLLELERQQLILMAQLRNDKLGEVGAEKIFQQKVYDLKQEYSTKGIGIIQEEVKVAKLLRDKAAKDYEDAARRELLSLKQVNTEKLTATKEDGDKIYKERLAQMKKWQAAYEQGLKDEEDAAKKSEDEKLARKLKAIELGQTLVDGAFGLYQAGLNKELAAVQARYQREIELAGDNEQKVTEAKNRLAQKEKEIKTKQFQAEQAAAIARVVFETASMVAKWSSNPITLPLAALTLGIQAAQIGFILAQPVPEFAEGTKGKAFEGGAAIVGERGVEKVITKGGKVYFTPNKASLVDLPAGSEVVPNHMLTSQERFLAGQLLAGRSSSANPIAGQLTEIGSILKNLPITQLNMDERGFEKYIRTPRRTTKVLNNRFGLNK